MAPINPRDRMSKVPKNSHPGKKTTKAPTSKQGFKSSEYVVESDTEGDTQHGQAETRNLEESKVPQNSSRTLSGKSSVKPRVSQVQLKKKAHAQAAATTSSSEGEVESSEDSRDEEDEGEERDSEQGGASEGHEDLEDEKDSADEEEQGEEEVADEIEVNEDAPSTAAKSSSARSQIPKTNPTSKGSRTITTPAQQSQSHTHISAPIPAVPFIPPQGFQLAPADRDSPTYQLFKDSNLRGKQIWYITAPSSVPINTIQNLALDKAATRSAAFTYEDNKYRFLEDVSFDRSDVKVMLPKASTNGYQISSTPVHRIITVQQTYDLSIPKLAPSIIPEKDTPRPQPLGMKMRFHPIGFEPRQNTSHLAAGRAALSLSPRRRVLEEQGTGMVEEMPKKKKKSKHSQEKQEMRVRKHKHRETGAGMKERIMSSRS